MASRRVNEWVDMIDDRIGKGPKAGRMRRMDEKQFMMEWNAYTYILYNCKTESESGVDIKTEMQAKKRDTLTRLRHAHSPTPRVFHECFDLLLFCHICLQSFFLRKI